MKFKFQGSDPELEYKITAIQVAKTEYGWRKVELILSDVEGKQALGSVRMSMAEMDISRIYTSLSMVPPDAGNQAVRDALEIIIKATQNSGGDGIDMAIMAESIIVNVITLSFKPDGYEDIINILTDRARKRLADIRLKKMSAQGTA